MIPGERSGSSRRLLVALGAAMTVVLGFSLSADQAAAGQNGPTGLRIVSPAKGALVASKAVRLKVRGAGRRDVSIFNGSRRLKRHLGAPRRGVRSVRLRRGRDLRIGTNAISVRARGSFDQQTFVLGRKRPGLLTVRRAPRRSHRGPTHVRARIASAVDSFRVKLNGHRVEAAFAAKRPRLRVGALNASHGLRFGQNRLVVTAFRADGRFDRETRRFRIDRSHPLAGAGRDRSGKAGRPLRLNGRSSRPTRRGHRLRFHWRVVSGPHHRRVKLRRARSARPRLIAGEPGRYRIRLVVREPGSRASGKAGQRVGRSEAGSSLRIRRVRGGAAADTATVTVAPNVPPLGLPIASVSPGSDQLTIGDQVYRMPPGQGLGPQLLVLDRKTLAQDTQAMRGYDFSSGGWKSLGDTVAKLARSNEEYLVILIGGRRVVSCDSACATTMKKVTTQLGGSWYDFDYKYVLGGGIWSMIGVPGSDPGSATQNFGAAPAGGPSGSLIGYLQPDNHQNYKFVWGQYTPIDTAVPGQPTGSNVIRVADKQYPSGPGYVPGKSGFQVLTLDQGNLQLQLNQTYWTNLGSEVLPAGVEAMAAGLKKQASIGEDLPLLVVIQSIGAPVSGIGPDWDVWANTLPEAIGQFGGTPEVLETMNLDVPGTHEVPHHIGSTPGGYSLVGGTDLPGYGTEETFWFSGQPARVQGMLARNGRAQYEVAYSATTTSSKSVVTDLSQVAYQPSTPWPVSDTIGEVAANTYISHQLQFQYDDVRTAYYEDDSANWSGYGLTLATSIDFPGGDPGFTKSDFDAVKAQLLKEMGMLTEVDRLIDDYQKLFGSTSEVNAVINLQSISHQIQRAVSAGNGNTSSSAEAEEITGILLGVAGEAGDLADPTVGLALSAAAAGFEIAGSVSDDREGNPLPGKVEAKADQLGLELADRYTTISDSLEHVHDLLVSDFGKLQAAYRAAAGDWKLNSAEIYTIQNALPISSKRWIYGALMPVAYNVYGLGGTSNSGSRLWDPYYYECWTSATSHVNRFEDADWSTYYSSRHENGVWYARILSTYIDFTDSSHQYLSEHNDNSTPPTWLTHPLFSSLQQGDGNLGMNQPTFFARNFPLNYIRCAQ